MSGSTDLAGWKRGREGTDCEVCRSKRDAVAQLDASWVLIGPDAEGTAFMRDIRKVSAAIAAIVHPVKMNYEIHGNTAPHLHVHFFPRQIGDQFEGRPIDPRGAPRPAYAPGEFERFRERLRAALAGSAP